MNPYDVLGILAVVLWVVFLVVSLYYKAKGNAVEMIAELIALAEQEAGKTGPEKMGMVVSWLYDYIPAAFRGILTKEVLQRIAQGVFNWVRRYAMEYLAKKQKPPEESGHGTESGEDPVIEEYEIPEEYLADDGK